MSFVFYGVYWRTNPNRPYIWYSDPKTTKIVKEELKVGNEFNIQVLNNKYCIGSEKGRGHWITCMERRLLDAENNVNSSYKLVLADDANDRDKHDSDTIIFPDTRSYKQCYRCSTTEYFTCRMTCVGDVCIPTSDRAKQLCDPPNTSVYLTYVGGEFKVGVSLGIPRRWIEQGSDLATVIATAPGLEARRLEQYLAQELDLKLQVRSGSKMKHLMPKNLSEIKEEFKLLIQDAQPMISKILGDIEGMSVRKPTIHDFHQIYGGYEINTPIQEVEVDRSIKFGGKIVGIKGNIIIVRQGQYHYALNLKRLESFEFRFLDNPPKIETQSYLDQWF